MANPMALIDTDEYTFEFGKYKGQFYGDVLDIDPWYIKWCNESIEWFKLADNEADYVESMCAISDHPSDPLDFT